MCNKLQGRFSLFWILFLDLIIVTDSLNHLPHEWDLVKG
jgi:hypothetical protein